jgi:hypothetical protein
VVDLRNEEEKALDSTHVNAEPISGEIDARDS